MNSPNKQHVLEYEFVWKIKNFRASTFTKEKLILSPVIKPKTFDGTRWLLCIVLEETPDKEYMSVYVRRCLYDNGPPSVTVDFEIGLMHNYGILMKTQFSTSPSFSRGTMNGFKDFTIRKEVLEEDSNFLLNDTLTLKGRLWRMSHYNAPVEKVLIRSKLESESLFLNLKIHPWQNCFTQTMNFNAVQGGFNFICKWDSWEMLSPSELRFPRIIIEPQTKFESSIFMTAQIGIVDKGNQHSFQAKGSHSFETGSNSPWCLPSFDGPHDRYGFIDIDDLNFVCEFTISNGEQEDIFDSTYVSMHEECLRNPCEPPPRNILAKELKPFMEEITFPDAYVKVGKVVIPAHRAVLSARSLLFRTLFTQASLSWELSLWSVKACTLGERARRKLALNTDEQKRLDNAMEKCGLTVLKWEGFFVLVFTKTAESNVRKMLSFMYTDDMDDVDFVTAMQLLRESDRYLIDGLKEWCESFLMSRITSGNLHNVTYLAQQLECEVLLKASQLFAYEYSS